MRNTMTRTECAAYLRERDGFLILNHRRPDGDAMGCAAALCRGLRTLGKRAFVLPNPETTERYLSLVEDLYPAPGFRPDTVVAVDLAEEGILQNNAGDWAGKVQLCIDHHPSNSGYARQGWVDPAAGACGELIYFLLLELGVEITPELAEPLYIAVTTDTGCFRYKNTSSQTLRVGAALLEAGAPIDLNRTLFMKKSRGRLLLESRMIAGLEFFQAGEADIAAVTLEDLRDCAVTEEDMEDIASVAGSVRGVELSVTLREVEAGSWKVSVRTGQYSNASLVCAEFGGGGHGMAAGCTVKGSLEEVREALKAAVGRHWHALPL
ncbi:MAG: DHH family phosphoesterase [Oscillospiraceae bacterium]|nr:DHH family phosphoesterase [Oscillospiraceae bacterium]